MTKKVSKESLKLTDEKLLALKKIIPEVFTEGKIDFEKLQRTLGKEIDGRDEKYSFNWAGRKEAFKNIQTTAKGTLKPAEKESVNWDSTENLFIEGDNLEVLKLLQKSYFNKVKMIYIDPPYNTGNDFVYKDDFKNNIKSYLQQTGQLNGDGVKLTTNPETSGRFHSNWMSMMYPRLFVARNLLKDDGVIFVSIDDNEVHNLRKIMDEIFGEENYLGTFVWQRRTSSALSENLLSVDHEYVLTYQKGNFDGFLGIPKDFKNYSNPDNDLNGEWAVDNPTVGMTKEQRPNQFYDLVDPKTGNIFPANPNRVWAWIPETMNKLIQQGRIIFPKDTSKKPMFKRYKKDLKTDVNPLSTILISEVGMNAEGTKILQKLMGSNVFNYSKPVSLIKYLVKYSTRDNDIVLDFFAGSATTAQAVLEQNKDDNAKRKFICVQLPEKTNSKTEAKKEGYEVISDLAKERITRVIKQIEKEQKEKFKQKKLTKEKAAPLDLGFKVFKLDQSNYKIWEKYEGKDEKELKKQLELFKSPLVSVYKEQDVIYECVIKEGYSLNSSIEKTSVKTNKVYKVTDGELFFYVCLDQEVKDKTVDELKLKKENMFICLDEALNDGKKKNLAIQCNLKTI